MIRRRLAIIAAAAIAAAAAAAVIFQQQEETRGWCANYRESYDRNHDRDLAKLTAGILRGYSLDPRACAR